MSGGHLRPRLVVRAHLVPHLVHPAFACNSASCAFRGFDCNAVNCMQLVAATAVTPFLDGQMEKSMHAPCRRPGYPAQPAADSKSADSKV